MTGRMMTARSGPRCPTWRRAGPIGTAEARRSQAGASGPGERADRRVELRYHEPPLRTPTVDQLLGAEARPGAQVGEVTFRRARPYSCEGGRLRDGSPRGDLGGEDVHLAGGRRPREPAPQVPVPHAGLTRLRVIGPKITAVTARITPIWSGARLRPKRRPGRSPPGRGRAASPARGQRSCWRLVAQDGPQRGAGDPRRRGARSRRSRRACRRTRAKAEGIARVRGRRC